MSLSEIETTRLKYVRVTNNLPFVFTDRHDGVPVAIMPGRSENLPLDMASHFFGPSFDPAVMARHIAKRQGWNTPEYVQPDKQGKTKAQRYFEMLKIEPVSFRLVEDKEAPDPRKPVPAEQSLSDREAPRRKGEAA